MFPPVGVDFATDLPHGRCVGVAIPAALTAELEASLHPDERAFAAALSEPRRSAFAAGRAALRAALTDVVRAGGLPLAAADRPLLPDARGAPTLPAGLLGSISHKRTLAVGLAALAPGPGAPPADVGVDLEEERALKVDISRRVLTMRERERLGAWPEADRDRRLIKHFCLKEAFYKAVNGFGFAYVSFLDAEVREIALDGRAEIVCERLFPKQLQAEAWVGSPKPGFIVAAARVSGAQQR